MRSAFEAYQLALRRFCKPTRPANHRSWNHSKSISSAWRPTFRSSSATWLSSLRDFPFTGEGLGPVITQLALPAMQHVRVYFTRPRHLGNGRTQLQPPNGGLFEALGRMCELSQLSRVGFYRWQQALGAIDHDQDLRDEMQRIAVEFPYYGWRLMQKELKDRGWAVNHKRVRRLMREDNLLCLRRRKFVVTTDSNHDRPVHPNFFGRVGIDRSQSALGSRHHVYTAGAGFVYLAVILDAFSRRVIGWALDRSLEDELTLAALRMALRQRRPTPGLVHHSDRGVQ
jgi:hypothetical protein